MKESINLFIYDLDNTLYRESDYLYMIIFIFSKLYNVNLVDFINSDYIENNLNRRSKNILKDLYHLCFNKIPDQYELDNLFNLYKNADVKIKLYYGAKELLKYTYEKGINLLVTNGNKKVQENKIKILNINNFFHEILILDNLQDQKPNCKKIIEVIKKFIKDKFINIYIIGDDPFIDVNLAKNIGGVSIRIKSGFYKNIESNANYEVKHISEIIYFFKNIIN